MGVFLNLLEFSVSSNFYLVIALAIVLAFLLFWICKRYFKKSFSNKNAEEQQQEDYVPETQLEPRTMVERINSDLEVSVGSTRDVNGNFRESKYKSPSDTREFKTRLFLNENKFKNRVEETVKRSLSGCFPVKYLRNFRMKNERCDFIIHWQDKQTYRWKCVLINCKFSFSCKESVISEGLDESIARIDKCFVDLEKYDTSDVVLKVIVVNFPIPESYEPFKERDDIICLNYKSVPFFLEHLTKEIFSEQNLSKGLEWTL